jgi:cobalt-zinc-cadmium efflux system outer membrane protein
MLMKRLLHPFRPQLAWILVLALYCFSLEANLLLMKPGQLTPVSDPTILDYDTAVSRTMNQSLHLSIAENKIHIKQGQLQQSRLYPNPSFSYDLQTSEYGWDSRQEIYSLSQQLDLAAKREKRFKIASNEYYAALCGYEVSKLEKLYQMTKNFIHAVAAQELFKIAVDNQKNSEEFQNIIKDKFNAGKSTLIEQNKANVTKALADLNMRTLHTNFYTAKKNLAAVWSGNAHDFDLVDYPFYQTTLPLSLEDYLAKLCDQPEIIRSLYDYQAAYHSLRLEKSERIPDAKLTLGYGYNAGDNGVVAGVAFPLPIWDQNQGNIKKAHYELTKVCNEGKQLWIALETKLSNAYIELIKSYQETEDLKNTVLNLAVQSFDLSLEGYREGKLDYINVLEAKNSLFTIREKYIQALANYHIKQAEIEFLNSQIN